MINISINISSINISSINPISLNNRNDSSIKITKEKGAFHEIP